MREKSTHLRQERDEALFAAYGKALREHSFSSQDEAVEYVRTHEAPKFYISGEFCYIVISRMLQGQPSGVHGKQSQKKFAELYRRFCVERNNPKNKGMSKKDICYKIVEQPAPEFYLNSRATKGVISEQKRIKCEEMLRKW